MDKVGVTQVDLAARQDVANTDFLGYRELALGIARFNKQDASQSLALGALEHVGGWIQKVVGASVHIRVLKVVR